MIEAISVPKENVQLKRQKWLNIRNLGNNKHHLRVYEGKAPDLVVRKRPPPSSMRKRPPSSSITRSSQPAKQMKTEKNRKPPSINSYVPCSDCLGYFNVGCRDIIIINNLLSEMENPKWKIFFGNSFCPIDRGPGSHWAAPGRRCGDINVKQEQSDLWNPSIHPNR